MFHISIWFSSSFLLRDMHMSYLIVFFSHKSCRIIIIIRRKSFIELNQLLSAPIINTMSMSHHYITSFNNRTGKCVHTALEKWKEIRSHAIGQLFFSYLKISFYCLLTNFDIEIVLWSLVFISNICFVTVKEWLYLRSL